MAKDDAPDRQGFLRRLLTDYKAFASLVGLLVYGVVRVAYDAYYTRLGVFPEAVGLSETTILGRAALYLALTVSIAAIFGGLWLMGVGWVLAPARAARRARIASPARLFGLTAALSVLAAGLVALGGSLRSVLGSHHLAYFCVVRCKFAVLTPRNVHDVRAVVQAGEQEHPAYRFVDFGPTWLLAVPLIVLLVAAVLGIVLVRRGRWSTARRRGAFVFALAAAGSLLAGLLAPHLVAVSQSATKDGHGFVDAHPGFVKWAVFVLVLGAVAAVLFAALEPLARPDPRQTPWLLASFVAVAPLLLGFFEPAVPGFIEEEGGGAVAAAIGLWLVLLLIVFWLWPRIRRTPALVFLTAVGATLTLILAWERGTNLAKKAAMADQISAKRFSLLSVRASVVCLDPTEKDGSVGLARRPYVYLGETGGTLVLYDYVADVAHETPTSFPVRMPDSGIVVRLAHYAPGARNAFVNWDCSANA